MTNSSIRKGALAATVAVVIILAAGWIAWTRFERGDVPKMPFKGLKTDRVLYCYNPPGFMGDGLTFAAYQMQQFDAPTWVNTANKAAKSGDAGPWLAGKVWIRGPIRDQRYVKAMQYTFTIDCPDYVKTEFAWRRWVKSDSCYFLFDFIRPSLK